MKRILIITLSLLLILPYYTELKAQDKVQGGMVIEKTTIHKEVKTKKKLEPVKPGYQSTVTFFSIMSEFNECLRFCFDYIGGYRINNYIFAGFGIGANIGIAGNNDEYQTYYYSNYYGKNLDESIRRPKFSVPLYAHLRAYMGKKRCQPFIAMSAGVNIAGSNETDIEDSNGSHLYTAIYNQSNLFIEPMVGLDIRLTSSVSLNIQLGANIHGVQWAKITDSAKLKLYKKAEGDFSFKLGCTF